MTHLDLFSGIGGFAYAADQVWEDVEHTFVEFDPFCQQVLKKHWPEAQIYGDIRQFNPDTYERGLERPRPEQQADGDRSVNQPWLLTGGFPCQPFSQAGVRRGTSDERYLWPEMLRVIRSFKPQWVIAENVSGLLTMQEGLVFEQVCLDLEAAGYEVQPFIIPAAAINAPHRRDRVWFVAHALNGGQGRTERGSDGKSSEVPQQHRPEDGAAGQSERADSDGQALLSGSDPERQRRGTGLQEWASTGQRRRHERYDSWDRDWHEVAAELCRVDDGLPVELDGFKLSKSAHRKERLKSLGNAIVPAVAAEIMRGMQ